MPRENAFERKTKRYARKKGFRKGTTSYNKYVYGTMSHRMAQQRHKRGAKRRRKR